MRRKGFFLVLEGIDGSGKTTIANYLKKVFENRKRNVFITQEPTKEKIGVIIREYLSEVDEKERDPIFEALAFAADRKWHIEKWISPFLDKGYLVISDRYFYSSFAYQTINKLDPNWLIEINKYMLKPNLAIFLDVAPEIAIKRIRHARNVFEHKDFLRKVYFNYIKMVDNNMLVKINGERKINLIVNDIVKMIEAGWK